MLEIKFEIKRRDYFQNIAQKVGLWRILDLRLSMNSLKNWVALIVNFNDKTIERKDNLQLMVNFF